MSGPYDPTPEKQKLATKWFEEARQRRSSGPFQLPPTTSAEQAEYATWLFNHVNNQNNPNYEPLYLSSEEDLTDGDCYSDPPSEYRHDSDNDPYIPDDWRRHWNNFNDEDLRAHNKIALERIEQTRLSAQQSIERQQEQQRREKREAARAARAANPQYAGSESDAKDARKEYKEHREKHGRRRRTKHSSSSGHDERDGHAELRHGHAGSESDSQYSRKDSREHEERHRRRRKRTTSPHSELASRRHTTRHSRKHSEREPADEQAKRPGLFNRWLGT